MLQPDPHLSVSPDRVSSRLARRIATEAAYTLFATPKVQLLPWVVDTLGISLRLRNPQTFELRTAEQRKVYAVNVRRSDAWALQRVLTRTGRAHGADMPGTWHPQVVGRRQLPELARELAGRDASLVIVGCNQWDVSRVTARMGGLPCYELPWWVDVRSSASRYAAALERSRNLRSQVAAARKLLAGSSEVTDRRDVLALLERARRFQRTRKGPEYGFGGLREIMWIPPRGGGARVLHTTSQGSFGYSYRVATQRTLTLVTCDALFPIDGDDLSSSMFTLIYDDALTRFTERAGYGAVSFGSAIGLFEEGLLSYKLKWGSEIAPTLPMRLLVFFADPDQVAALGPCLLVADKSFDVLWNGIPEQERLTRCLRRSEHFAPIW